MNGGDLGQVAQNMITYFGGAAGGYILAAALIICAILAALHILPPRAFLVSFIFAVLVWSAAFMLRQFVGFA